MPFSYTILNGAALIYGGAVDYKRREIPNTVPLILIATGFVSGIYVWERFVIMLALGVILWLSTKDTNNPLPGGDFKLICALTFSVGLPTTLAILLLVGLGAIFMSIFCGLPLSRHIPLCSYAAPVYLLILFFSLSRLFF